MYVCMYSKITLTFAAQDNGMTNRFFIGKAIEIADVWWKSIATIKAEQSMHELRVC